MTETVNLKLKKPSGEDFYNIDDFNCNADILDAAIVELSDKMTAADEALKGKAEAKHRHTVADISDFPEALPASGGNADKVDGKDASDFLHATAFDALTHSINDAFAGTYSVEQSYTPDFPSGFGTYGILDSRVYGSIQYQTVWFDTGIIIHRERIIGATDWSTWKKVNDGGNADTLGGKHASDFTQNLGYLTTGSLLDYVLTLTESGSFFISSDVTDTPISGLFYGVDVIRHTGGDYVITATRFNGGGVWTNRYNSGAKKWYGWANVADGGNAATANTAGTLATTASNICLRNLSSGTADVTDDNCPLGAWYGQHD